MRDYVPMYTGRQVAFVVMRLACQIPLSYHLYIFTRTPSAYTYLRFTKTEDGKKMVL